MSHLAVRRHRTTAKINPAWPRCHMLQREANTYAPNYGWCPSANLLWCVPSTPRQWHPLNLPFVSCMGFTAPSLHLQLSISALIEGSFLLLILMHMYVQTLGEVCPWEPSQSDISIYSSGWQYMKMKLASTVLFTKGSKGLNLKAVKIHTDGSARKMQSCWLRETLLAPRHHPVSERYTLLVGVTSLQRSIRAFYRNLYIQQSSLDYRLAEL